MANTEYTDSDILHAQTEVPYAAGYFLGRMDTYGELPCMAAAGIARYIIDPTARKHYNKGVGLAYEEGDAPANWRADDVRHFADHLLEISHLPAI